MLKFLLKYNYSKPPLGQINLYNKLKHSKTQLSLLQLITSYSDHFKPDHITLLFHNFSEVSQTKLQNNEINQTSQFVKDQLNNFNYKQLLSLCRFIQQIIQKVIQVSKTDKFKDLFNFLYEEIKPKLQEEHYYLVCWCLAKQNIKDQEFFIKTSDQIIQQLKQPIIESQEEDQISISETNILKKASLLLWAQKQLNYQHPPLALLTLQTTLDNGNQLDLKNAIVLLQSTVHMQQTNEIGKKLVELLNLIKKNKLKLKKQSILNLKNLLYVLPKIKEENQKEFGVEIAQIICQKNQTKNNTCSVKFASQIIWSLGNLKVTEYQVYQPFAEDILKDINKMTSIDVAQLFSVFVKFTNHRITQALIEQMKKIHLDPRSQALINEAAQSDEIYSKQIKKIINDKTTKNKN